MDDPAKKLNEILSLPADEPVDMEAVADLTRECPAFLLPEILLLRHPHGELDDVSVGEIINRIALSIPDRRRLIPLLDPEGTGKYDRFYPHVSRNVTPSTNDVIDTFLTNYGDTSPEEEALLQRMIFNPVPDYAATLERETPVMTRAESEQDRLLDAFISSHSSGSHETVPESSDSHDGPQAGEDSISTWEQEPVAKIKVGAEVASKSKNIAQASSLSESLARIFIKQHNYKRAYEIIESLSLNYPEKSVYFADQLRFLGKIIKNREAQERKNNIKN